jgi:nucleoside-diphosphate-sugar epimerase
MARQSKKSRTLAITGATGFVGKHLIEYTLANGYDVRALTRKPQSPREGLTWIEGDLNNEEALEELVKGVGTVIHIAGLIKALTRNDFFNINEKGTLNVIKAVKSIPRRFRPFLLHISSLAAREPLLSDYAASKTASENTLKRNLKENWAIIRPPVVYGQDDLETLKMFTPMTKGYALAAGSADNRFSIIHVDDLAKAFLAVAKAPACHKKTFELDDGLPNGTTISQIANMISILENRNIRIITLNPKMVRFAGKLGSLWGKITRRPQMFTHLKANELLHPNWVVDAESQRAFIKYTGWKPTIDLKTGIKATLKDYREKGML